MGILREMGIPSEWGGVAAGMLTGFSDSAVGPAWNGAQVRVITSSHMQMTDSNNNSDSGHGETAALGRLELLPKTTSGAC